MVVHFGGDGEASMLVQVFAKALLEGLVIPSLATVLTPNLTAKPCLVLQAWTQTKIVALVNGLRKAKCASRSVAFCFYLHVKLKYDSMCVWAPMFK